jgi:hypothetical protein
MRYAAGFISAFYNPLKNPNAPTIGTASAVSATSLSIAFTAPSNVGGSAITSYIATAKRTSDGVLFSASGASSPITITGLTSVPFTVTVAALNSYGSSALSAESNSVTPALLIGSALGGGYFAGQIGVSGVATHNLIVGPVASTQTQLQWKIVATSTTGTSSNINGPANSAAMNDISHPAAQFCEGLSVGGFSDWYMPAKNELEICYFNLKLSTSSNNTISGINPNAVPARASNYTSGNPAQTSAAIFRDPSGAERFQAAPYWSSTESTSTAAWKQNLDYGYQSNYSSKTGSYTIRAIRRVAV